MSIFEIPLNSGSQTFTAALGPTRYKIAITWREAPYAGYFLDISDLSGVTVVSGIAMVTGVDLLEQYRYRGFAGGLWILTDSGLDPTYDGLGTTARLYYVSDA